MRAAKAITGINRGPPVQPGGPFFLLLKKRYNSLMPKKKKTAPIAPQSVPCPFCGAQKNEPCKTAGGNNLRRDLKIVGVHVALLHVDRILKAKMARPPLYDDRLSA